MEVKNFQFNINHQGREIKVDLTVFKPAEHTLHRALIEDRHFGKNNIILLYRRDDGSCFTYESVPERLLFAKAISKKIKEIEKENGSLVMHSN